MIKKKSNDFVHRASRRLLALTALSGTLAAIVPGMAAAQTAATGAQVDSNTIIVTAQRRAEAVEDVPMSVSVLPPETLKNLGVNSVRDLANVTTGLQVNNSGSYPQPAIRGITTINAGAYENNVALFVDGLYQYTAQVLNMDLPNVQNIQVLKGPQGTLYGRNATGGAILIDTIDPGQSWQGNAELTYGRFDDKRARAYVAGPLSDTVGISVAGTVRHTDGYYKVASRTTPGEFDGRGLGLKQESIRAKIKFDVTETFRATLGYNYMRASDARGVFFTATENVSSPYTGANATRPRELGEVAGDAFALDLKQHEASLKLELDTGIGTLRSVTGYTLGHLDTAYDADGTYAATSYSDSRIRDRTWQEALDFTIDAIENVDLIVGGTYYNINTRYDPDLANVAFTAPAGSQPGTPLANYRRTQEIFFWRKKEAWAGFVDATIHLGDKLSLNLGGRYSKETQDVAATKNVFCISPATQGGCTIGTIISTPYDRARGNGIPDAVDDSSYAKFTPRASIRYEIAPRTNIYASYSKGFRSGEWNAVPPVDTDLTLWKKAGQIGQESVDSFEIGFKTAGSRLRANLAAFYSDYKDLQVSYTQFQTTQQGTSLAVVSLQSVPHAKVYGIEGDFDWEPIDDLHIRAGATLLHARYGDNSIFVGTSVNPTVAAYNSSNDPLKKVTNRTAVAMDISGMQMARAPDFSAFLGFDYLIRNGEGGLRLAANAKYTDSYVVTNPSIWGGEPLAAFAARQALDPKVLPNNAVILGGTAYADRSEEQRARQGKYVLLNASITWSDPTDRYYVRVWGNNLTDVTYKTHYNPSSQTYAPVAEPRTYGLTIGYKFGS